MVLQIVGMVREWYRVFVVPLFPLFFLFTTRFIPNMFFLAVILTEGYGSHPVSYVYLHGSANQSINQSINQPFPVYSIQ